MTEPVLPVEPVGRAVGATATLSFVGGFVDVVGFIALFGLFTAHVTGNFIMLGLEMVHATKLAIAKLLAVPIFIVMVALTRLFVLHYEKRAVSVAEMLLAQAALLDCFMIAGGLTAPHDGSQRARSGDWRRFRGSRKRCRTPEAGYPCQSRLDHDDAGNYDASRDRSRRFRCAAFPRNTASEET